MEAHDEITDILALWLNASISSTTLLEFTINALVGCTMAKTGKKTWIIPCILFGLLMPLGKFRIASTNDTLSAFEEGKKSDQKQGSQ